MSEVSKSVKIPNPQGLHARPCSLIVKTASGFAAEVTIENEEEGLSVNAKMILEVMTLAAPQDTELTIAAEGEDAEAAVDAIMALVADGFGEM